MMECPACGVKNPSNDKFCGNCGVDLKKHSGSTKALDKKITYRGVKGNYEPWVVKDPTVFLQVCIGIAGTASVLLLLSSMILLITNKDLGIIFLTISVTEGVLVFGLAKLLNIARLVQLLLAYFYLLAALVALYYDYSEAILIILVSLFFIFTLQFHKATRLKFGVSG